MKSDISVENIDKKVFELLKNRTAKETSFNVYLFSIKRFYRECFKKDFESYSIVDFYGVDRVLEFVEHDVKSKMSQKVLLFSIMKLLEIYIYENILTDRKSLVELYSLYKIEYNKYKEIADKNTSKKDMEKDENYIDEKVLNDLKKEYKSKITKEYSKYDLYYVVLCLYTMIDAKLRGQDFYNTYLFDDSSKEKINLSDINYIDLKTSELYINNYKTNKKNKVHVQKLTYNLCRILNAFKKKSGSEWLIPQINNSDQHADQHGFYYLMRKIFKGKKIGSRKLRQINVSKKYDEYCVATGKDKIIKAKKMCDDAYNMKHTIGTHIKNYTSYSKK